MADNSGDDDNFSSDGETAGAADRSFKYPYVISDLDKRQTEQALA